MNKWYAKDTGSDQGLIIDENTGESIAVSYKLENAPMIAFAPEAINLLRETLNMLNDMTSEEFATGKDKIIRNKISGFLFDLESSN